MEIMSDPMSHYKDTLLASALINVECNQLLTQ